MLLDGIKKSDFLNHFDLDGDGTSSAAERDIGTRLFDAMQAVDEVEGKDILEGFEVEDFFADGVHAAEVFDGLRSRASRTLNPVASSVLARPGMTLDAVVDAKAGKAAEAMAAGPEGIESAAAVRALEELVVYLETLDGVAYAQSSVSGDSSTAGSDAVDLLDWAAEQASSGGRMGMTAEDIADFAQEYKLPGLAGLAVRTQWRIDDMRAQLETLPATDEVIESWVDGRDLDDAYDREEIEREIDEYVRILKAIDDAIAAFPAMRREAQGLEKLMLEILIDDGAIDFTETAHEPLDLAARHYRGVITAMAKRYGLSDAWVRDRLALLGRLGVEAPALIPMRSLQPVGFSGH